MVLRVCVVALLGIAALAAGAEGPAADGAPDADETSIDAAEGGSAVPADSDASSTDTDAPPIVDPGPGEPPRMVDELFIYANPADLGFVEDKTVSVIGFDLETIKAEGIGDIRDLSNFTPALQIKSAFAASNPTIFIRGIGLDDFNANSASAVAIYQDGVYMQSPAGQLFQFYDVEGAEVLRGPQPSLYRNAEAGAILVRSKRPTEEFEGYLTTTYGNFDDIATEAAFGGPIFSERLLGRISGSWGIRDGLTKNRCASDVVSGTQVDREKCFLSQESGDGTLQFDSGMDDYTNDVDAWASRGQLLLKLPSGLETDSDSEWLLNVHGGQNRSRALQFQHRGARFQSQGGPPVEVGGKDADQYQDTDGDVFAGEYNIDGPEEIDLFGSNLDVTWPLGGGLELHGLTAYEWNDGFTFENTDASPRFNLESQYEDTAWQISQELELRGEWPDSFASEIGEGEWRLGGYYLKEDLDVSNLFDSNGEHLKQEYTQETRNYAGYVYSEYRLRPGCDTLLPCDFTLIGGVRYNVERKAFVTDVCQFGISLDDGCAFLALENQRDSQTWTGPGGEVSLAWDFAESSSLYVKYSHGWKGGHFNGGATTVFDVITGIDPETVDSYEGGLRSYWFDDRLMLNVTGFLYDYQDLQVFIIEQTEGGFPIPKLANAAESEIYGIEVDLGMQPLPDLNLTYNFAWVESEYEEFIVAFTEFERVRPPGCPRCPGEKVPFSRFFDYSGNSLIGSPRHSMTGSIEYTLELPGRVLGRFLGSLTPRYSFSWRDDVFFDQCSGQGQRCNFDKAKFGTVFGQEAYWVHNAALTWRSEDERIEVLGWVHNFLDEEYKTQNFDLTRGLGIILDAYADPRTYGVTVTLSF